MWTTYLRYPKKCMRKKQQKMFAFRKKGFVRPHKNLLGTFMLYSGYRLLSLLDRGDVSVFLGGIFLSKYYHNLQNKTYKKQCLTQLWYPWKRMRS